MMSVTLTLTVLILMGVSTVSATRATLAVDWCAQVCYCATYIPRKAVFNHIIISAAK